MTWAAMSMMALDFIVLLRNVVINYLEHSISCCWAVVDHRWVKLQGGKPVDKEGLLYFIFL